MPFRSKNVSSWTSFCRNVLNSFVSGVGAEFGRLARPILNSESPDPGACSPKPESAPVLNRETPNAGEVSRVVRDQRGLEAQGMSGDQQVHRSDRLTGGFEIVSHIAVSGRCLDRVEVDTIKR